jgi:hypothetical protein
MANPAFSNRTFKFKKCCIADESKYVHIVMAIHYLSTLSFDFTLDADLF